MMMIRYAMVASLALSAAMSMSQLAEHVPGELLVKFVPGQSGPINQMIGAQELGYNTAIGVTRIKLPRNVSVNQGIAFYKSKLGVMYAEPNYIQRNQWIPNDPRYGQQYALPKIQAPAGWDSMRGDAATIIAIVDTGVSKDHEDLAAKLLPGYDFVNDDADPDDDQGHGTHCAGIAAAITNNGKGIAGLAVDCSIMPVKVLNENGSGAVSWIINGITWAADNGAHVISLSLGGGGASQAQQDSLRYAIGKGSLPVAAAGNHGTTQKIYPAGFPEALAVAATDANDNKANFSAFGSDWVGVAAPGVNIMSCVPGNSYGPSSGTSMACPYVAGLAGLIKSAWKTATVAELRSQIEGSCDFVGDFVKYGRINVFRAIPSGGGGGGGGGNTYNLPPTAIFMYEGTVTSGNVTHVATSDNAYYTIVSKAVSRVGHVATSQVTFRTTLNPTRIVGLNIGTEVNAPAGVTTNLFVYDNVGGKWQYVGAYPMNGTDVKKTFSLSTPYAKYWNANRELKVLVRSVMPEKMNAPPKAFNSKTDQVWLSGRLTN